MPDVGRLNSTAISRLAATWRGNVGSLVVVALCFSLAVPAVAMSLKSIMGQMGDTTKQTKHFLAGPFAAAEAKAILAEFAQQTAASEALFAGRGDAKAQDLRGRFRELANIIESARGSVGDKASFRRAFAAMAENCHACHTIYK